MLAPLLTPSSEIRLRGSRAQELPEEVFVCDVARACRSLVLSFLSGVDTAWTQADYEQWLSGPYADVTAYADTEAAARGERGRIASTMRARACGMSDDLFTKLLWEAQGIVVRTLRAAAPPRRDTSFAGNAIRKGWVVRARDEAGDEGWIPVCVANLWPVERVLSLVAADFLTRPRDYELACAAPLAMWQLSRLTVR